jgi:hypothetical protein
VRLGFSAIYIVVALALLVHRRRHLPGIFASLSRWERPSSIS